MKLMSIMTGQAMNFKFMELVKNALMEERWKLTLKRNIEQIERQAELFKRFWKF